MPRMEQESGTETHDNARIMRSEPANNANEQCELGEGDDPCATFMSTGTGMEVKRAHLFSTTKDEIFTAAWRE